MIKNYTNYKIKQINDEQKLKLNYFALTNTQIVTTTKYPMQQKQRFTRISQQLNKLNSLIEFTKNQSLIAFQALKNCHDSSSESLEQQSDKQSSHNVSQMFEETDSRSTIPITGGMPNNSNNKGSEFNHNKSLQMSRPIPNNGNQQNSSTHFDLHGSHLSSDGFKESIIQISQIKPVDTTVKKAKLVKSNMQKQKKTLFDKERVLSKNQKAQKINRIKSQNKLISNTSTFKRGINMIKQQLQSAKKQKQNKTISQIQQKISIPNKNYLSNKIETLNSRRNLKYNSVTKDSKHEKIEKGDKVQKIDKNSKSKFHINLQKQVTSKITDLKIKKNLCLVETSYLSASVKIIKQEITTIQDSSNKYSDETLLKYFILKSIIKFISQYNDQTWTNSQDIQIDSETVSNTIKRPQKFIKIINKLPDILRRKNIVSESICKEFIEDKSFIDQKLNNLAAAKGFQKQPLYIYLCELHLYIEFLLNNNMIHQTKRHKIFNPTSEEFFSDRSAKEMKLTTNAGKEIKFESKNKEFSQRKKPGTTQLKRVNTSKALKKGVTTTKPKKV